MTLRYCPQCTSPLASVEIDGFDRLRCTDSSCDYVFWNNPTPVVAAIVEHNDRLVIARNAAWPDGMFGLVTGYLEACEDPAEGVQREVNEELGLDSQSIELVGLYPFARKNQLLIAYHVVTYPGHIRLNAELAEYKALPHNQIRYWPGGTGLAVKDFLEARGYNPQQVELPPRVREFLSGSKKMQD